jgi:hypothetical protein
MKLQNANLRATIRQFWKELGGLTIAVVGIIIASILIGGIVAIAARAFMLGFAFVDRFLP